MIEKIKTPEELTADWKAGRLASGLYYVGNDKVKDFAFVKSNEMSVYTLDSKIPMLLKDNAEILDPVPTYEEYKAMQAELAEHRHYCCCAENEVMRLKLAEMEELLRECLAHLSLGKVGTSVTPVNILLTRINAALSESEK